MNALTIALFTFNSQKYVERAIRNLLSLAKAYDLLIVDDGSTDETNQIISRLLDDLDSNVREKIIYRQNYVNIGTVQQFLNAANLCKTKYIKPIDCADIFLTNNFGFVLDRFEKYGSDVIFTRPSFVENGIIYEDATRANLMKNTLALTSKNRLLSLYTKNNLIAPTAFFRTEFIQKIIPNLGNIRLIEDWPMWIYASFIGSRFDYVDKKFVGYRIHANQSSRSLELREVLNSDLNKIDFLKNKLIFKKSMGFQLLLYKVKSKIFNRLIAYV